MEKKKNAQEFGEKNDAVRIDDKGLIHFRGRPMVDDILGSLDDWFGFLPSGQMLVSDHLMKMLKGEELPPVRIPEVANIFKHHPEDLAKNRNLRDGMQPMYFFARRNNASEESIFAKEDNVDGFWKTSETDVPIKKNGQIIGLKNKLVFCNNKRTTAEWSMSEYRVKEEIVTSNIQFDWVICKIYMYRPYNEDDESFVSDWYYSSGGEEEEDVVIIQNKL